MNYSNVFPVFTFLFLAALPGRTTFVMLLLATRSSAIAVFTGAVLAFFLQSLISVFLGSLMGALPHHWVNLGAGFLFLFFSFRMWRERNSLGKDDAEFVKGKAHTFKAAARKSFFSVFAAEWGDVSQLAIASVAANQSDHFLVWVCASLALALTALLAVGIGSHAHRVAHPKQIHIVSLFAFAGVGIYFLVNAFQHWK